MKTLTSTSPSDSTHHLLQMLDAQYMQILIAWRMKMVLVFLMFLLFEGFSLDHPLHGQVVSGGLNLSMIGQPFRKLKRQLRRKLDPVRQNTMSSQTAMDDAKKNAALIYFLNTGTNGHDGTTCSTN